MRPNIYNLVRNLCIESRVNMNLFKVSFGSSNLNDADLKKTTGLWSGNMDITISEFRQKWDPILLDRPAQDFLKRLRQTATRCPVRLRKFASIEELENFDTLIIQTLDAFERSYLAN